MVQTRGSTIVELTAPELATWSGFAALGAFEQARLGPSSRWLETGRMRHFLALDGEHFLGRLTAFVNPGMRDQTVPTGAIGCLDFERDTFRENQAPLHALVERACAWLASEGMERVRAPLNFSTWNSYRAISSESTYPRFMGENVFDERFGRFFEEGFTPVATYRSALLTDIESGFRLARLQRMDEAESRHGVRVDVIERQGVGPLLPTFFELASRIFPLDWAFTPIGRDEFDELLFPVSQQAPGFLAMIARSPAGAPIGLCYGFQMPGVEAPTAILKTLGVDPAWQGKKVSWLLCYKFHTYLIERGTRHFIHAMMKEDNRSRHMSDYYAQKIRGYTLYERALDRG